MARPEGGLARSTANLQLRAVVPVKKIINDPSTVVAESLRGLELAHSDLIAVVPDPAVVVRADAPVRGKVAVISGGGSGHEPMHGCLVGPDRKSVV